MRSHPKSTIASVLTLFIALTSAMQAPADSFLKKALKTTEDIAESVGETGEKIGDDVSDTVGELNPCSVNPPYPVKLSSDAECNHCTYHLLPGKTVASPHTDYTIHSDLPEILTSEGVAYATVPVLPPYNTKDGTPVTEEMRTQVNNGFEAIDDDFEVFLFHISQPGDGNSPRRLVVYTKNNGETPVIIEPEQVIITDGTIGTVHEMESTLGRRVLEEDWDTPFKSVMIPPGEGEVVAYSKQFAAPQNGDDSSANVNCFGIVRTEVKGPNNAANLDVYVVAIPGVSDVTQNSVLAEELLEVGANSGEGYIDLNSRPTGCQLRRACGVFESFEWHSDPVVIDSRKFRSEPLKYQMALPAIQTDGCEDARQTVDLILSQPSNRPDTVGNYMIEYEVDFRVIHKSDDPVKVDFRFGKSDADIGLAWQVVTLKGEELKRSALSKAEVRTAWAGPKQTEDFDDNARSFLEFDGGPIVLEKCDDVYIRARFMVLGNSSLPFQLSFHSEAVE